MSQLKSTVDQLQEEIASLRQEVEKLNAEKADLQLLLEIITTHSDYVEGELWENATFVKTILKTSSHQFSSPATEEQSEPSPRSLSDKHVKSQEDLARESLKDPLTKLYRRHYMEESLIRELTRCRRHNFPLTVLMVEIDHFQSLKTTLGPKVAAIALQEMGHVLGTSIRREDIACRYNGENFTLVLPQATPDNIKRRAEEIRLKVKKGFKTPYQDDIVGITVSMGLAGFPDHGITSEELLGAADLALSQAKEQGADRVEIADDF